MLNAFETSGNSPTSVYLVGSVEHCVFKIGVADDAQRRLKQISTACPYSLSLIEQHAVGDRELAFKVEKALHDLYADKRIRSDGEWFFEVDKEHFKQAAISAVAMFEQAEEEKKNAKYVVEYTDWYNSTKQTQGEHPVKMSLRLLGSFGCPLCPQPHRITREDLAWHDGKVFCREFGTITVEELCARALQDRDRIPTGAIPI